MLAHFLSCPLPLSFLTEERTWEAVPLPHTPEGQCGVYFLFSHTFKQLHWTVRGNYMLPAKVSFQVTSWFLWQRRVKEGLLQPEILVTGNSFKQTHMLIIYIYKKTVCSGMTAAASLQACTHVRLAKILLDISADWILLVKRSHIDTI